MARRSSRVTVMSAPYPSGRRTSPRRPPRPFSARRAAGQQLLDGDTHAVVGVGGGDPGGGLLHVVGGLTHRHASAGHLEHLDVGLGVAHGDHVGELDAEVGARHTQRGALVGQAAGEGQHRCASPVLRQEEPHVGTPPWRQRVEHQRVELVAEQQGAAGPVHGHAGEVVGPPDLGVLRGVRLTMQAQEDLGVLAHHGERRLTVAQLVQLGREVGGQSLVEQLGAVAAARTSAPEQAMTGSISSSSTEVRSACSYQRAVDRITCQPASTAARTAARLRGSPWSEPSSGRPGRGPTRGSS